MPASIMYAPTSYQIDHVQLKDIQNFAGSDNEVIRIYILRHGESALNVVNNGIRYVQGQSPSVELTDKGLKQADKLAEQIAPRMAHLKPLLITSTAKRAIDTANPLAKMLNKSSLTCSEFLELGSGKWEGVSKEDPEYVSEYNKWRNFSANEKFSSPKVSTGESYSQVALRALEGLSKILSQVKQGETVFLFSHYMLMNAVVLSLTNSDLSLEPKSPLPECNFKNGDIMMIEIPKDSSREHWRIRLIIHSNLQTD